MQVLGGADLFLQGLIVPEQGLGTFAAGDLMLASIPQNQYPFAIGIMETSSADIAKHGLKGKGLKLLHCYSDMLWSLGDKSVPDPSFTPARIFPQVMCTLNHVAWQTSNSLLGFSSRENSIMPDLVLMLPTLTNSLLPVGFISTVCTLTHRL